MAGCREANYTASLALGIEFDVIPAVMGLSIISF
jgi:hypothetical protein